MGGRGSSKGITGGTRVSVPDKKRRPRGRSQKLKGEAGNPTGDGLPLRPRPAETKTQ